MASEASRHIQSFIRTIGEDIALYRKLAQLLSAQPSLYLAFDAHDLQQNIDAQKPLLTKLNGNATLRSQIMKKLGLPATQGGTEKLFKALPQPLGKKVVQQWQLLGSLIAHCQQLNQSNGSSCADFHELVGTLNQPIQYTYAEHC